MRTTSKERAEVIAQLTALGITHSEAEQLRRIAGTLRNWFELECRTGDAQTSVSIERDGEDGDGKPYRRVQYMAQFTGGNQWIDRSYPIADREAGARKRLAKIMAGHKRLAVFVQTDCRGASLYLLRRGKDFKRGEAIDSVYTRGVAVY